MPESASPRAISVAQAEAVALTARVLGSELALPAALSDAPEAPLTRLQAAKLLYLASKE